MPHQTGSCQCALPMSTYGALSSSHDSPQKASKASESATFPDFQPPECVGSHLLWGARAFRHRHRSPWVRRVASFAQPSEDANLTERKNSFKHTPWFISKKPGTFGGHKYFPKRCKSQNFFWLTGWAKCKNATFKWKNYVGKITTKIWTEHFLEDFNIFISSSVLPPSSAPLGQCAGEPEFLNSSSQTFL